MTRSQFLLLGTVLGLTSCGTMHNAAVSTFRVVDAPHQYVRRQLGIDENDQPQTTTTTTTTETTYSQNANYPPQQQPPTPYTVQRQPFQQSYPPPAPPPNQAGPQVTSAPPPPPPEVRPTATPPRVVTNESRSESKPMPTTGTTSSSGTSDLPYAKPVPGKPGYVYSPYDPNGGYVDVKGFAPGQKVKDPYSGKIFLVP